MKPCMTLKQFLAGLLAAVCILTTGSSYAKPLPAPLTGAIIIKLLALESHAAVSEELTILVINDSALAQYLNKKIGSPIGNSMLTKVWTDQAPANQKPDVIYFNNGNNINNTMAYAKSINALTISNDPAQTKNSVVLFIYDDEGLPGIAINVAASKAMGFTWSDKILKISTAIH